MSNNGTFPFSRLSRRDFLKLCAWMGVLIGAGPAAAPKLAQAYQELARRPTVVWSLFQECLGCSVNLLQSRKPQPAVLLLQEISLAYHEAINAASGDYIEQIFEQVVSSGDFYYIAEGAIATGIPGAMTVHGRTSTEIVKQAYQKAKATIAIGSCACYGNIQAAYPNPTGAKGVAQFLREDAGIDDPVVINISRCPGNAEDTLAALSYILYYDKLPELDSIGRPKFLYGGLIHDNCERRAHFEAGEFIEHFGDEGSRNNWCWFKMGCKGPITFAPCPITRWNGQQNWCIGVGPCIGCAEPSFWDDFTPFYSEAVGAKLPGVGGLPVSTIGIIVGGVTAAGIAGHAVGQVVTGRWGKGAPLEPPPGGEPGEGSGGASQPEDKSGAESGGQAPPADDSDKTGEA